jgi:putative flippase GtrA
MTPAMSLRDAVPRKLAAAPSGPRSPTDTMSTYCGEVRPSQITSKQAGPARLQPAFMAVAAAKSRGWVKRKVPARFHKIGDELAKFGLIGIVNIGVNFAVVNVLWATVLANSEVKAKAIATVVAATSAYFMNRHWTYKDRPKSSLRREYTLFFAFNLVGLVIEVATLSLAKYGLHQSNLFVLNIFTGLGIVIGTVFRFWAYRTHVFKVAVEETAAAPAAASSRLARLIRPRRTARASAPTTTAKVVARTAHTSAPHASKKGPAKATRTAAPARTKS